MASSDEADPHRRLLTIAATGAIAGVGLTVGVPGAALLLHPLRRKTVTGGEEPVRVPVAVTEVPTSRPVRVELVADRKDGWTRFERITLGAAFLIRDGAGPIRAFSAVCPHLGCTVEWDPRAERFECPCHQSGFGVDGRCLYGPAPRGLDELDVIATGEELRIRYRRFRTGSRLKEPIG